MDKLLISEILEFVVDRNERFEILTQKQQTGLQEVKQNVSN